MSHIFLSYSRADRPTAQIIAEALEAEGFSVWWDKVLRAGQTYDEVTENMLRDSAVVIVLWSQTSVKSKWVRAEATLGQRSCEMVPAMIEDADRPIMFELTQTADLIGWNGDRSEARWTEFVADIKRSLEKHSAAAPAPAAAAPTSGGSDDATIETVFWTSIKDGDDPADFEAYLKRYPDGHYAALATNRLAALQPPTATPDPTPTPPVAETPAPAAQPAPAAPAAAAKKPEKKKSSSPLPLLLGAALVVGVGGWFGLQALGPSETEDDAELEAATPPPPSCDVCPKMVELPGGSFTMGSPSDEANRSGNEGPQREVTLQPFAISATEITRSQWQLCVDAGACSADQGGEGDLPVTRVSYDEAVGYANWLSQQGDRRYRLPSEAQWEYAARGGTNTPYWWGGNFPGPGVASGEVADTSALPDNPFGVSGMLGNVREWVADCYVNNYREAPTDGSVVSQAGCDRFVVRGGSWRLGAEEHRAANRARFSRSIQDRSVGFRVVAQPSGD
nr:SUMF1/EgtB/PvdO family nonheme iron enzyme [Hyphomonas sp. Mor2]